MMNSVKNIVRKDIADAWIRSAVTTNDFESCLNCAFIYSVGYGVQKDDELALHWFKVAATNAEHIVSN